MQSMPIPVVFLDKDGTLVVDVPYNVDVRRIKLTPYAWAGLKRLAGAGFKFIVITNQSGIAQGVITKDELEGVHRYLEQRFKQQGLELLDFYYCPHLEGTCGCRKPQPGLIKRAQQEHDVDLSKSWFIGDIQVLVYRRHP
jgi:D-glycero-D-manno-heptose 1,7-bisphosphate phosphatase